MTRLKAQSFKRLVIGLTGIFGSGKSAVAGILKKQGAFYIDSDRLAHEVFLPRHPLYPPIRRLFGVKKLSRRQIAEVVFNHRLKRKRLEAIIHPYVFRRITEVLSHARRGVIVVEVPLLFESGFHRLVDKTVVVTAAPSVILKRLREKGFSDRAVKARWKAQWPDRKKRKRADYLIVNSHDVSDLKKQVMHLWHQWKSFVSI